MKCFYVMSLAVALLLAASPFLLLPKTESDPYPGKVVWWDSLGSEVKSIDPATCGDTTSAGIQGNIYEGLYCYHYLKRPVEVIPHLAESMPDVSPDGLTYTIRLKDGVMYHRNPCFGTGPDGRALTRAVKADDFVLAFKRCADYHVNTGLSWAFLSERVVGLDDWRRNSQSCAAGDFRRYDLPVEGIKALDDRTLRIRLVEPFPPFIYILAMSTYAPTPREAVDYWLATEDDGRGRRREVPPARRSTEFRQAEQAVGTGPYVLKVFDRKSRIVLVRNEEFRPDFYPAEGEPGDREAGLLDDAGKRVPFIDVIHEDFVPEDYSAWMRFLSRQTEAAGIPQETFRFVISPDRRLAESWRNRHIYLRRYFQPSIYWIVFNMEDPVLGASRSLRQAMCLCYDVENHVRILLNDRGKRAVNVVPSTFKGWQEAGPGPYFRLDVPAARQKMQDARLELAEAGQLRNGQVPELRLDLGDRDTQAVRTGEFVQQQFSKIGLRIKVVYNDWPTLQEKVNNKAVQMYMMGWHADYPDPENFLQLFYSPNIARQTNNSNYSNPEFDRLYEQVRTMPDSPQRTGICARMIRMISEDCPVLLLNEPEAFALFYDWVKNTKPHPIGYGFTKYRRIDTELRRKLAGR